MCVFAFKKGAVNRNLQISEENTCCEKTKDIRKWIRVTIDENCNKKAVVIGFNPSEADGKKSDRTLTKTARYLSQYEIGQFTMINLFETISKLPSEVRSEHRCNLEEYRSILEEADMIFVAWGTEGHKKEKCAATQYLMQFKDKVCCVERRAERKPVAHPRRIRYEDELVYYFPQENRCRYKVVTLCGSVRFRKQFMEAQEQLTLEGNIVLSVGLFGHSDDEEAWEGMDEGRWTNTKKMLDDMHKAKINMSDEIFVINVGGDILGKAQNPK